MLYAPCRGLARDQAERKLSRHYSPSLGKKTRRGGRARTATTPTAAAVQIESRIRMLELEREVQDLRYQLQLLMKCIDENELAAMKRLSSRSRPNASLLKIVREAPPPSIEYSNLPDEEKPW